MQNLKISDNKKMFRVCTDVDDLRKWYESVEISEQQKEKEQEKKELIKRQTQDKEKNYCEFYLGKRKKILDSDKREVEIKHVHEELNHRCMSKALTII
ncbi:MAG: hypothetical protein ACRC28_15360 [Clostridium sp.]|uniref:hypothetical protein n=1 Tax=Clostridium sp. TaxID=1506 RepID=UPI003F3B57ED